MLNKFLECAEKNNTKQQVHHFQFIRVTGGTNVLKHITAGMGWNPQVAEITWYFEQQQEQSSNSGTTASKMIG